MTYELKFSNKKMRDFLESVDFDLKEKNNGLFKDSLFNRISKQINHINNKSIVEVEYALPKTGNIYLVSKEFLLDDSDDNLDDAPYPYANILNETTSCMYLANIPFTKSFFSNKIDPSLKNLIDTFQDQYDISIHKTVSSLPRRDLSVCSYSSFGRRSRFLLTKTSSSCDTNLVSFLEEFIGPVEEVQKKFYR